MIVLLGSMVCDYAHARFTMVCDYAHGKRLEWYAITLTLDSIEEAITVCDYARDRGY